MNTYNTQMYQITLLRHGQSVGNAKGYHQGQHDFPLTEIGKAQSQALAQRWLDANIAFEQIISSPLSRARETAEIIAKALHLPLEFDPLWMERDNGQFSGLTPDEAAQRQLKPDFLHPYQKIGVTGESQWELYMRAGNALQNLLHRPRGRYLVVSHGGILNMVLYASMGITPQANFQGPHFRFRNTAFATLTYNPQEHYWRLESLNDRLHWQSSASGA